MTNTKKDLAQLGTTPADHQAQKPIDVQTLGRLSRSQLKELLWGQPSDAIAQVPSLAPFRDLMQAVSDAETDYLNISIQAGPHGSLTPEQEAEAAEQRSHYNAACDALQLSISEELISAGVQQGAVAVRVDSLPVPNGKGDQHTIFVLAGLLKGLCRVRPGFTAPIGSVITADLMHRGSLVAVDFKCRVLADLK